MSFDYDRDTRRQYQHDDVARHYHDAFANATGLRALRFRAVARAERRTIERMLHQVPHAAILDIPAGTGKLGSVFKALGCRASERDVSPNMLAIAEEEFARIGYDDADFGVADAADMKEFAGNHFDAVVCLRLMHRVPAPIRAQMLAEFARVARYAVVSFGIETPYHRARRFVRGAVFGGGNASLCYTALRSAREEVRAAFEILCEAWILPGISQESVFLLRARSVA